MAKNSWRNRIVGNGDEPLDAILFNPANWRIHPKVQQEALTGVLEEIGFVQQVVINRQTGNLVDGHLRCQLAARNGEKTIPAVYVDLTPDEELAVLATLDPISAMASTDKAKLENLLHTVKSEDERVQKLISEIGQSEGLAFWNELYTRNIQAPIYYPSGEQPSVETLYDPSKTKDLVFRIDASGVTEAEKEFLRVAAQRHTILDFRSIADYYAHASSEMQSLMEESALVIIDFGKAIEGGYVKLAEALAAQYSEDYRGDDDE